MTTPVVPRGRPKSAITCWGSFSPPGTSRPSSIVRKGRVLRHPGPAAAGRPRCDSARIQGFRRRPSAAALQHRAHAAQRRQPRGPGQRLDDDGHPARRSADRDDRQSHRGGMPPRRTAPGGSRSTTRSHACSWSPISRSVAPLPANTRGRDRLGPPTGRRAEASIRHPARYQKDVRGFSDHRLHQPDRQTQPLGYSQPAPTASTYSRNRSGSSSTTLYTPLANAECGDGGGGRVVDVDRGHELGSRCRAPGRGRGGRGRRIDRAAGVGSVEDAEAQRDARPPASEAGGFALAARPNR